MLVFSAGRPSSLPHGQGDHGEGLVDLEQVDVGDAPAHLVQQLLDRPDRRGREPLRLLAVNHGRRRSCARGLRPSAWHFSGEATSSAAAPSLMLEALPAVTVPSALKAARRPRILRLVELVQALVLADRRGLAPDGDRDRSDLVDEDLVGDRLAGPGVALDGEVVLLLPGDAVLGGALVGEACPWACWL